MIEHSANVAMSHAWSWAVAVRAQAARIVDGCGTFQEVPDAMMMIGAVRNVRRAAAMALQHLSTDVARVQLQEALDDFDAALPGISAARNVIEHFDEYSVGVGHLQQPEVSSRLRSPDEQLAQQYRIYIDHADKDPQHPLIRIGPFVIDLAEAGPAASRLVHEIWAANMTDEGKPVSRQVIGAFLEPPPSEPRT